MVDVAAFGGQQQHAIDRLEALHGNGNGQHQLVLLVDPLCTGGIAGERARHFGIDAPVVACFDIGRKPRERADAHDAVIEPGERRSQPAPDIERRQFDRFHHIAGQQIAGIDDQPPVGAVKPRPQTRGRDELAQQRFGLRVVDGETLVLCRIFRERAGDDQRFLPDARHAFVDEAGAARLDEQRLLRSG